jgi:hypothetical protein
MPDSANAFPFACRAVVQLAKDGFVVNNRSRILTFRGVDDFSEAAVNQDLRVLLGVEFQFTCRWPFGSRLGPYEIVAPLGTAWRCHRARDTKLKRQVALKVERMRDCRFHLAP